MYVPFDRLAELDTVDQAEALRRLKTMPARIVTDSERHAEQIRELRLLLSYPGDVTSGPEGGDRSHASPR